MINPRLFSEPGLEGTLQQLLRDTPQRPDEEDGDYYVRVLLPLVPQVRQLHERFRARIAAQEQAAELITFRIVAPDGRRHSFQKRHAEAFCQRYGLKWDKLVAVLNGEVDEHKGWHKLPGTRHVYPIYSAEAIASMKNILDPFGTDEKAKSVDLFTGRDTSEQDKRYFAAAKAPEPEIVFNPEETSNE